MKLVKILPIVFTSASFLVCVSTYSQGTKEWNIPKGQKRESRIDRENTQIRRNPVIINKSITYKKNPNIFSEDLDLDNARRLRANQKTAELISKIQILIKREKQRKRLGELKMRLAELYYDQARIISVRESRDWEKKLDEWEKLKPDQKAKYKRPDLRTPKADNFRRKTLSLYSSLERASRGRDQGRSQMIKRDDVLFYLASTYMELNQKSKAIKPFYELTRKYPNSPRTFSARLNLADLYFDAKNFRKALPEYLVVVRDSSKQKDESSQDVKIYALYKAGWSYFNLQRYTKAIQAFRRTIEESSGSKSKKKILFEQEALADLARAYAMAGKYSVGERYFKDYGNKEMLKLYQQTAAQVAKDKGHYKVAQYFYGAIIKSDPYAPEAREVALEQADLLRKYGKLSNYAQAVDALFENYGEDSRWLSKQEASSEEKKIYVKELVDLSRSEAKNLHNLAQRRKGNALYLASIPLYKVYFKNVPDPNKDSKENVHDLKFYYAELLYKLGKFPQSAKAYADVGDGKYEAVASYNIILAYREAAKKDKKYSKSMIQATESFVKEYPSDKRASALLYAGAFEAFKSGSYDDALGSLEDIVEKFPDSKKGVESAERILFIHEKKGNLDKLIDLTSDYSKNSKLTKVGGAAFVAKLTQISEKARFKKLENLSDSSESDAERKAEAFLDSANSFSNDLKEKALNNANVFAEKSKNIKLIARAKAALVASFPRSNFAKNVYLKEADEAVERGEFREAQAKYENFLKTYKKDRKARESADWNILYIQAHYENVIFREFKPRQRPSKSLLNRALSHLRKYPKSKNREFVMGLIAFRNGATLNDLARLKKLPGLNAKERSLLAEAEAVVYIRTGKRSYLSTMLKKHKASASHSPLLKEVLASAKFNLTEPSYVSYSRLKINFSPAQFANTLKRKLNALEKLEKDYLGVVAYGDGGYALKSLQRISSLYKELSVDVGKSTDKEAAPILEENYAKPMREKSLTLLRRCFEKAVEFKIAGQALSDCRKDLDQVNPQEVILKDYVIGEPRWIPIDNSKQERPLMKVLTKAFESGNEGVFLLTVDLMDSANPSKTTKESAYINNMAALIDWKRGDAQSSYNSLSSLATSSSSDLSEVREAAIKNMTSILLLIGDSSGASDMASSLDDSDWQVAELLGLAHASKKKFEDAVDAFDLSIRKNDNNSSALFNLALAYADWGKTKKAIDRMKQYTSRFNPPTNHLSRKLIASWSSKK